MGQDADAGRFDGELTKGVEDEIEDTRHNEGSSKEKATEEEEK